MAQEAVRASSGARRVRRSREELLRQAGPASASRPDAVQAVTPDAQMYGVFQPAYAASLAQRTGAAGADILNQGALMLGADREAERYGLALQEAQRGAERMQHTAGYYNLADDAANRNVEYTDRGMGGAETIELDPTTGMYRSVIDPVRQFAGNTEVLNNNQAERYGDIATATKNLYDAGIGTTPTGFAAMTQSPYQEEPTEGYYNFLPGQRTGYNPGDQNDAVGNDIKWFHEGHELELAEASARIRAAVEAGEIRQTIDYLPDGTPITRFQGRPEVLQQYGIDPATGQHNGITIPGGQNWGLPQSSVLPPSWQNPNAGAQGGGASATPAAGRHPRAGRGDIWETHNNPGNIRIPGQSGFQRFRSIDEGIDAQESLLARRYFGRGLNTVQSIIETYAPRRSRGGDNSDAQVNNYIARVSRELGVSPGQQLPREAIPQLASAMRIVETGGRVERRQQRNQPQMPQRNASAVTTRQPAQNAVNAGLAIAQSIRPGATRSPAALSIMRAMTTAGHTVQEAPDGGFTVTTASGETRNYGPNGVRR